MFGLTHTYSPDADAGIYLLLSASLAACCASISFFMSLTDLFDKSYEFFDLCVVDPMIDRSLELVAVNMPTVYSLLLWLILYTFFSAVLFVS